VTPSVGYNLTVNKINILHEIRMQMKGSFVWLFHLKTLKWLAICFNIFIRDKKTTSSRHLENDNAIKT